MDREQHLVELVDDSGAPVGTATVAAAHADPGGLHRAFSVLLLRADGQVLLQRRAAVKSRFPLAWANSCCGHPAPGEPVTVAAQRRLGEELGLRGDVPLTEIGVFVYRASDPSTGKVEQEYDHVLLGLVGPGLSLDPDPAEVAEVRWVDPDGLGEHRLPGGLAPWLSGVLETFGSARPAAAG